MTRPLSNDLRQRVVAVVEGGTTRRESGVSTSRATSYLTVGLVEWLRFSGHRLRLFESLVSDSLVEQLGLCCAPTSHLDLHLHSRIRKVGRKHRSGRIGRAETLAEYRPARLKIGTIRIDVADANHVPE